MSVRVAIVCDCCGRLVAFGATARGVRSRARRTDIGVNLRGKDMCGKCWGRGCEFGKPHLRRAAL